MINETHAQSLTRQAELLGLSRSLLYYRPVPASGADPHLYSMVRGFVYLVAVIDWFSRRLLS